MAPRNNDIRQSTREERAEILLVVKNAPKARTGRSGGRGISACAFSPDLSYNYYCGGLYLVSRTYGIHKNLPGIYLVVFTNDIWSYLLCPPANSRMERENNGMKKNTQTNKTNMWTPWIYRRAHSNIPANSLNILVNPRTTPVNPSSVLPSSVLPSSVLTSSVLSSSVLTSSVLSSSVLSSSVLSSSVLPSSVLTSSVLTSSVLTSSVLTSSVLTSSVLPSSVLPSSVLTSSVLTGPLKILVNRYDIYTDEPLCYAGEPIQYTGKLREHTKSYELLFRGAIVNRTYGTNETIYSPIVY